MPRAPRQQSEADIYHVFARGTGHQLIFESDRDRVFFLDTLGALLKEDGGDLLAWVLMGNHFHLLLRMPLDDVSECMRSLQSTYALRFNQRYERSGHLFQGRFGSQPINSDEQLLACVRYIHRNPVEAGLCKTCDYKWSSYRGYLQGAAVTDTSLVLALFGGVGQFIEFHQSWDDGKFAFMDLDRPSMRSRSRRLADSQASEVAAMLLGQGWRGELPTLPKPMRDAQLRQLKEAGLSALQIERLTGIGRNIINRA